MKRTTNACYGSSIKPNPAQAGTGDINLGVNIGEIIGLYGNSSIPNPTTNLGGYRRRL